MRNNFDISSLETCIADEIKSYNITSAVYNNRPKSTTRVDDFIVVSVSGQVEDYGCYGVATIGIDLFARDINNFKNSKRLEVMYESLMANLGYKKTIGVVDYNDDHNDDYNTTEAEVYLLDGHATVLGDTPDDYGFTARLINIKVTIKI